MKNLLVFACGVLLAVSAFAQGKSDPVAEGYPDWTGITAKNYVRGRILCPSDLRHKLVLVVEIDPKDAETAKKQFLSIAAFTRLNFYQSSHFGISWETHELPREPQVVISNYGVKDAEILGEGLKTKVQAESTDLRSIIGGQIPIYNQLSFAGAPSGEGKRPFVYLMGPEGTEPLVSGPADRDTLAKVRAAVAKGKKNAPAWRPFYGTVEEPQFFKSLTKTLNSKKPKPLTAEAAKIKRKIKSKNPDEAKEAQILFDALEQTRSDLIFRIQVEAAACPHRAAYDIQKLLKYWPGEKKRISEYADRIKEFPECAMLAKVFSRMMEWSDPEFAPKSAGEAKKIVAELGKMKKILEKLKESKIVVIQNGASLLEAEMDGLISAIPSKVPEK